jgi:plastocyanin
MSASPTSMPTPSTDRQHGRRWPRRVALGLAILLVITIASTSNIWLRILRDGAGQEPVVGVTEIVLRDDWFTPSVVEVPAGSTVTFTWDDGTTPHDILFDDGVEAELRTDGTFQRTVPAGDTTYRCTLHPGMNGRLVGSTG